MHDKPSLAAEELAARLEAKAKRLRESGLTPEELEKVAGGITWCGSDGSCCGSSCRVASDAGSPCASSTGTHEKGDGSGNCWYACIESSPD